MTVSDFDWLWEQSKKTRSIFLEPGDDDEKRFKELLEDAGTFGFIIDDGALIFLCDLAPNNHAFFNGLVWNPALYGQSERALAVLRFLFELFGLRRMSAVVPEDNDLARRYVEGLNFKYEGTSREAIRRENGPIGLHLYGLLRREVDEDERVETGPTGAGAPGMGGSGPVDRVRRGRFSVGSEQQERGTSESGVQSASSGPEGGTEPAGRSMDSGRLAAGYRWIKGVLGIDKLWRRGPR
jgi:RimJ/RimL family protein N-acetyltransferase